MEEEIYQLEVSEEQVKTRLDKLLSELVPDISRARVKNLIETGSVTQNGAVFTNNAHKVKLGEAYEMAVPEAEEALPIGQDIPLEIIYEDEDVLVINKPVGMVVHPAPGNPDGTLVNALIHYCGDQLSGINGVKRPGIVHRLDKDTSGLMMVAKNDMAHQSLSKQLSTRALSRIYQAFVWGRFEQKEGRIETFMGRSKTDRKKMCVTLEGGKEAITEYKVIQQFGLSATLVECHLKTGRTHQIRVHMAHLKNWLVGDHTYCAPSVRHYLKPDPVLGDDVKQVLLDFPRQALHAAGICFIHPRTGEEMEFRCEMPDDLAALKKQLVVK